MATAAVPRPHRPGTAGPTLLRRSPDLHNGHHRHLLRLLLLPLLLLAAEAIRLADGDGDGGEGADVDNGGSTGPDACGADVLTPLEAFPMGRPQGGGIAQTYYSIARDLSREGGQGSLGWLFLLATLDFAPHNATALEPVLESYLTSKDYALALGHVKKAVKEAQRLRKGGTGVEPGLAKAAKTGLKLAQKYLKRMKADDDVRKLLQEHKESQGFAPGLAEPRLTLPFSTVIGRWDLYADEKGLEGDVQDFYDAIIRGYNLFKNGRSAIDGVENGDLKQTRYQSSDTKLNHDFYDWQMEPFKATGKYWSGFEDLPVFHKICRIFREAAKKFLMSTGLSEKSADLKARSRTVVWVSVHTGDSNHGPHNTEDSMVGGVFYVKVPPGSGSLLFSDPRGKNSVMQAPAHVPTPPFHKMFQVDPYDGMLILFPGWLVHQVAPSPLLNVKRSGYRVSVSFNLNGEWAETTPAVFDSVHLNSNTRTKRGQDKKSTERSRDEL